MEIHPGFSFLRSGITIAKQQNDKLDKMEACKSKKKFKMNRTEKGLLR
jgi:hypothetical protein